MSIPCPFLPSRSRIRLHFFLSHLIISQMLNIIKTQKTSIVIIIINPLILLKNKGLFIINYFIIQCKDTKIIDTSH